MDKVKFQVINNNNIRTTSDNGSLGTLVNWITEIAGIEMAIEVQGWSEICVIGEYFEGENFEVICIE
jgi:hypothetical protein